MQIAMQIAIIALMSTFVYALVALGFTLVFGILRVVNFAHGEFYMLGAVLAWDGYFVGGQNDRDGIEYQVRGGRLTGVRLGIELEY